MIPETQLTTPIMAKTNKEEKHSGAMITWRRIPYSPIAQQKGTKDDVARRGVPGRADSETPEADGVKEHIPSVP